MFSLVYDLEATSPDGENDLLEEEVYWDLDDECFAEILGKKSSKNISKFWKLKKDWWVFKLQYWGIEEILEEEEVKYLCTEQGPFRNEFERENILPEVKVTLLDIQYWKEENEQ